MTYFNETDKLVTHYGCLDGSACAVLFIAAGGKEENIHFSSPSHDSVDQIASELFHQHKGRIFFADISVSEEMAMLLNERKDILLFDHHKSAIPLAKYSWCEVDKDNTRCGSMVFRDFIYKQDESAVAKYAEFITLVDDRDRWVNRYPESKMLSELFYLMGQPAFISRMLGNTDPSPNSYEQLFLAIERNNKEKYIKYCEERFTVMKMTDGSGDHNVGFVICDKKYTSDVGNHLIEKYKLDAAVLIGPNTVSFRAPNHSSIDVSALAQKYGGGGHQHASGCSLQAIIGRSIVSQVTDKLELL
jgi:oligoribonuclease NrnB/cAMP/cGMP phosphodiesterase (DHH superfamily)